MAYPQSCLLYTSRKSFESLTPIFPNEKISVGKSGKIAMRMIDLLAPIGKGQRGIIVSPPKAGKTTLLKDIALACLLYTSKIQV